MALGTFDITILSTKPLDDFHQIIESIDDIDLLQKLRNLLDKQGAAFWSNEIANHYRQCQSILNDHIVSLKSKLSF